MSRSIDAFNPRSNFNFPRQSNALSIFRTNLTAVHSPILPCCSLAKTLKAGTSQSEEEALSRVPFPPPVPPPRTRPTRRPARETRPQLPSGFGLPAPSSPARPQSVDPDHGFQTPYSSGFGHPAVALWFLLRLRFGSGHAGPADGSGWCSCRRRVPPPAPTQRVWRSPRVPPLGMTTTEFWRVLNRKMLCNGCYRVECGVAIIKRRTNLWMNCEKLAQSEQVYRGTQIAITIEEG
ncbi:hypothetical protein PG991_010559 [Apiospora marii]|uniref:Uncharacterized protein n=1 Tax=Apiospora marii TaxID=335849 RepID=A0ABR1RBQ0_9PEZI